MSIPMDTDREIALEKSGGKSKKGKVLQISLPVLLFLVLVIGACCGVLAQLIRQINGPLMTLGASTAPWITVGFLLAAFVSNKGKTPARSIIIGIVTTYFYLVMWLFFYHLLFILQENLLIEDGLWEAVPWLILALPVCPILGIIAAMVNKSGMIGDICLAIPIIWSLPEALIGIGTLKDGFIYGGWLNGFVIAIPVAILVTLLIRTTIAERRVNTATLLVTVVLLGILVVGLYPTAKSIFPY
jgi:hypothetical protein